MAERKDGRVKVENLPEPKQELTAEEAQQVKGGAPISVNKLSYTQTGTGATGTPTKPGTGSTAHVTEGGLFEPETGD